jgi:1,2-diacylglycerol 3-alpha-glucosyltransferase
MNILMMTNTYKPLIGGLEKSVEAFGKEFRKKGHRVVIVAPEYEGMEEEVDIIRIPAIQKFNGSPFSVQLPIPGILADALGNFRPHIVHSHHPFLVGDTALRVASKFNAPLIFTHHSLYEENVHYIPGNENALKRFVIELATGYANLADRVFAPSESVRDLIIERGVTTDIDVVPTGIYINDFKNGNRDQMRKKLGIPQDAFVVGHIGRLAPEKNLEFLAKAVAYYLKDRPKAHFLIGGNGPSKEMVHNILSQAGVDGRLHFAGLLKGKKLADAYHAMDVFVFASQSETQGLVLAEAMAAGTPIVAVDAPGVRDIVKDDINGRLLPREDVRMFAHALSWMEQLSHKQSLGIKKACLKMADNYAMEKCVDKALSIYASLAVEGFLRRSTDDVPWESAFRLLHAEWELIKNLTKATGAMVGV